jgi:transcriptional regulator with XRE-family HTH domain
MLPMRKRSPVGRETLGQFLRSRRLAQFPALSQSEIARRANLANSTISRIEKDQTADPPLETLARLAPHYGVGVLELWDRAGYMSRADADSLVELLSQIAPLALVHLGLQRLGLPAYARDFLERQIQSEVALYQQRANAQG